MHRLSSPGTVFRFRFAAWLLLLKWLLVASSLGMLVYSVFWDHVEMTHWAIGLAAGALLVALAALVSGSRCRCPLCLGYPMGRSGAVKNRHAKRFCGSTKLRVALAIIATGYFRCPYCNEPTEMAVRERGRGGRSRTSGHFI